jgi:hypothetical protein
MGLSLRALAPAAPVLGQDRRQRVAGLAGGGEGGNGVVDRACRGQQGRQPGAQQPRPRADRAEEVLAVYQQHPRRAMVLHLDARGTVCRHARILTAGCSPRSRDLLLRCLADRCRSC